MTIDREKYRSAGTGESKPKLTADMIPTPKAVLTIRSVNEVPARDQLPATWAIVFEEFPNHTFWTNKTQQDAFLDAVDQGLLPDDLNAWAGQRIPLYKRENTNPQTNQKVMKLYPVPVELWDTALAQFDAAVAAARKPVMPNVPRRR